MASERKSFSKNGQRGNAMVYVLIIVALFAALSFVLARQSGTSETDILSEEQVGIYASQMQQAAMQLKQAVEQMTFTGSALGDLDFTTPDDGTFDDPPFHNKVFHPRGGGVILPRLPDGAVNEIVNPPPARWYIGRNNDVEWTPTDGGGNPIDDVILTAYQLTEDVCARLNENLTGSTAIPVMTEPAYDVLFFYTGSSTTIDFSSADCPGCDGQIALCVEDSDGAMSFYSLIATEGF